MKIVIVGFGTVGKQEYVKISKLNPDIYDVRIETYKTLKNIVYDFAIICVPTPTVEAKQDLSHVKDAINRIKANIYILKSTVLPGTTDQLIKDTGKNIIFSPEYNGETQHSTNYNYCFTILGGDIKISQKIIQMYIQVCDGRHRFKITTAKTAELAKYMHNSFMCLKTLFCAQFWEFSKDIDVAYVDLRECFIMDERVNPSNTFVYEDHPFTISKCLVKDLPALEQFTEKNFIQDMMNYNRYLENKYK
jgi:UDP-glucose 6-dehydrogenase